LLTSLKHLDISFEKDITNNYADFGKLAQLRHLSSLTVVVNFSRDSRIDKFFTHFAIPKYLKDIRFQAKNIDVEGIISPTTGNLLTINSPCITKFISEWEELNNLEICSLGLDFANAEDSKLGNEIILQVAKNLKSIVTLEISLMSNMWYSTNHWHNESKREEGLRLDDFLSDTQHIFQSLKVIKLRPAALWLCDIQPEHKISMPKLEKFQVLSTILCSKYLMSLLNFLKLVKEQEDQKIEVEINRVIFLEKEELLAVFEQLRRINLNNVKGKIGFNARCLSDEYFVSSLMDHIRFTNQEFNLHLSFEIGKVEKKDLKIIGDELIKNDKFAMMHIETEQNVDLNYCREKGYVIE